MSQKQRRPGTSLALRAGDREMTAQSPDMARGESDLAPWLDTVDVAVTQQPRIVCFPQDYSVGSLYVRDSGDLGYDSWQFFGEARGAVAVPEGKGLRLRVYRAVTGDLWPLATLKPDDLQSL